MTTPKLPHGHELPVEGSVEKKGRRRFGGSLLLLVGLVSVPLVYAGCAGDLEQDPNAFTCAFQDTAGDSKCGGTAQGGSSAQGGSTSMGGSGGGSTTGGGGNQFPPDDDCVAGALMHSTCTLCHTATPVAGGGLSLVGSDLGKRLATTQALYMNVTKNAAACVPGNLIIDPNNPSNSLLLKKITGTQECGDSMPPNSTVMGDDLTCLQGWIAKFKP